MGMIYVTFTALTLYASDFASSEQLKAFENIQTQVKNLQIDVQKTLDTLKKSFTEKKSLVTAPQIQSLLTKIQQTINTIENFVAKIKQSKIQNTAVIQKLHQLMKNVFSLGNETNIMTELQESVSLLMGPLQNQKEPDKGMRAYLQRNFSNTGIDLDASIYPQVGLPEKPTHAEIMNRYTQMIENKDIPASTKFIWRQLQYIMRQPIGMLMYNLWLQNKKAFSAVFSNLPKSAFVELYNYLNITYRQKVYELSA